MTPTPHSTVLETLRKLYRTFAAQQSIEPLFGARCCGRSYIGNAPAVKCRTCDELPKNVELRSEADLDSLMTANPTP
jgi:hypothetical protein